MQSIMISIFSHLGALLIWQLVTYDNAAVGVTAVAQVAYAEIR